MVFARAIEAHIAIRVQIPRGKAHYACSYARRELGCRETQLRIALVSTLGPRD